MDLAKFIRDVPDFPKPGIVFKDITPLLRDIGALKHAAAQIAGPFREAGATAVAGIESRGFIIGPLVAEILSVGFIPMRKPGKLPWKTLKKTYSLEYGEDAIEVHRDAAGKGDRVLLVDDLLATGGTMAAARELVQELGAEAVGAGFIVELDFLKGRGRLQGLEVVSLIHYDSE